MDPLDKKRQEANRELVQLLKELVEKHPSQRFGQILRNYGFVEQDSYQFRGNIWLDEFNVEPWNLLDRVKHKFGKP